jgi:hypothetical protein
MTGVFSELRRRLSTHGRRRAAPGERRRRWSCRRPRTSSSARPGSAGPAPPPESPSRCVPWLPHPMVKTMFLTVLFCFVIGHGHHHGAAGGCMDRGGELLADVLPGPWAHGDRQRGLARRQRPDLVEQQMQSRYGKLIELLLQKLKK